MTRKTQKAPVDEIVKLINENSLTDDDLSAVFRALRGQKHCLGGKIWCYEDIWSFAEERYPVELSEPIIEKIAEYIENHSSLIDDYTNEEWHFVNNAIKALDIFCNIKNIEWDQPDDNPEAEDEGWALNETDGEALPTSISIPLAELEDWDISEYLEKHYPLIKGYKIAAATICTK